MKVPYYLFIQLLNFNAHSRCHSCLLSITLICISWSVVYKCLIPAVWNYVMCFIFRYMIWIDMWHFWTCFVCTCVLYSCVLFHRLSYDRVLDLQNELTVCVRACVHASVFVCERTHGCIRSYKCTHQVAGFCCHEAVMWYLFCS